jgi:hypothetical protein
MLAEVLEDALGEGITTALGIVIRSIIGYTYLHLRYWSAQQVRQVLAERYSNQYSVAGSAVLTKAVQAVIILLLLALWIGVPLSAWLHR